MPIIRTGESAYDREIARWDRRKDQFVINEKGEREYGFNAAGLNEKYPQSLYKAFRNENGKAMCRDISALYSTDPTVQARAEAFNTKCHLIVRSEDEYQGALRNGWRDTQEQALDLLEAQQRDIAQAAAEAAYAVQRMGDKAQREYHAHDAATEAPAADVPAPAKKRGRKPNAPMVTVS